MRVLATILSWLATFSVIATGSAQAQETHVCWHHDADQNGVGDSALVCRVNGTLIVEFPTGPPVPTVPEVGSDGTGTCWYRRSGPVSGWFIAELLPDRQARLYWAISGGAGFVGEAVYRACVTEPRPTIPPITAVWDYLERYPFAIPDPVLAPPDSGITGLATFVGIDPPRPFTTSITSPSGSRLDIEISVATVTVDFDDNNRSSLAPASWHLLAGYPDGAVSHVYETRGLYQPSVAYNWFVRWRAAGGIWRTVDVPPSTWSEPYRIDELVGRRTL